MSNVAMKLSKANKSRLTDCIEKGWPCLTARVINSRANDKILLAMCEVNHITAELRDFAVNGGYVTEVLATEDKQKIN